MTVDLLGVRHARDRRRPLRQRDREVAGRHLLGERILSAHHVGERRGIVLKQRARGLGAQVHALVAGDGPGGGLKVRRAALAQLRLGRGLCDRLQRLVIARGPDAVVGEARDLARGRRQLADSFKHDVLAVDLPRRRVLGARFATSAGRRLHRGLPGDVRQLPGREVADLPLAKMQVLADRAGQRIDRSDDGASGARVLQRLLEVVALRQELAHRLGVGGVDAGALGVVGDAVGQLQ